MPAFDGDKARVVRQCGLREAEKTRLIEALFDTATKENANEIGPDLLSENRITMVAYGVGEVLDGNGKSTPRRVDIFVCSG